MEYIGEHLWAGQLGNVLAIFSFSFALLATFSYFSAEKYQDNSWKKLGRLAYAIHAFSVIGVAAVLLVMFINQYFEYHYIWHHSSSQMPLRYVFSAFWEGQEGSFILWMFWQALLGLILMKTSKSWESSVMTVFSSVQVFLASMILGIYVFDYKIGSSPFLVLLREHPDFVDLPLFKMPDYVSKIDGRGLNPLLQNYWMTIHPPTLFLGFASTLIPFSYAVAALWRQKFFDWINPVLPWTFFSISILGLGILMGGAWAYEALSFGGFWAWDPVENASLVPWLTLVGAGHIMLLQKRQKSSPVFLYVLTLLTFLLGLYSTFLTRSGVLGESSVHAFTDLGMSGQLLVYLLFYVLLSVVLIAVNYKKIPKNKEEEHFLSREFWMFIGALVLFVSAFQIIFTTSIPVINKVLGTDMAPPVDRVQHYNIWQIPFAVVVLLLIGATQFMKYKKTDSKSLTKEILPALIISLILTIVLIIGFAFKDIFYIALLFASIFGLTANADFFVRKFKLHLLKGSSAIAHIGFSLLILGALISTSKSTVISGNTSGVDISSLGEDFQNQENILLFKGDTLPMGAYKVSYRNKRKEGVYIKYTIEYYTKDNRPAFVLEPTIQVNPRMGNVAEPDTKHFLDKDIYTHITYADLEVDDDTSGYTEPEKKKINFGDSIFSSNAIIVFDSLSKNVDKKSKHLLPEDIAMEAVMSVYDVQGNRYEARPLFVIHNESAFSFADEVEELGIRLELTDIIPDENLFEFALSEKKSNKRDFVIMKAIVFPWINVLWLGIIIMTLGSLSAVVNRIRHKRASA
jgi:cytochrome c-type biogenesis protein CcmF